MFTGTYTAIVTPFRDGALDEPTFTKLVEEQIAAGIDGIVAVGTTGESPTLDNDEHLRVIELAVKTASGRCKIIAGTGSNSTAEAIHLTHEAERLGADATLQVAPYYNRPTQEGLFLHFSAIAAATKLPVILYSVPARCGVEIGVETTARLAKAHANIISIKEAGGSVDRVNQLRAALPPEFIILSGDDALTIPMMAVGAVGVISVASNIVPAQVGATVRYALKGDYERAQELHLRYLPLYHGLSPNPIAIKTAMAAAGMVREEFRLPLCEMEAAPKAKLLEMLKKLEIL
jgi:4-hydroxy-tetrahydrodipicolinate synthase